MSNLIIEVCKIEKIIFLENANKLEMVQIKGWNCLVGKTQYKVGDLVVFVPPDSIVPQNLIEKYGLTYLKNNGRIGTIKLRGYISQGLILNLPEGKWEEGDDVANVLNIVKYEPPEELPSVYGICNKIKKMYINSNFHKYTDIENIKNHPNVFEDGESVYISEKMHGTSFRAGWIKNEANTLWKKIKNIFGFLPSHEFIFGSRNVQLSYKNKNKYFYDSNVYAKTAEAYDLKNRLQYGEVIYGEIVGHGIQKRYSYGYIEGVTRFYAYDIMKDDKYMNVVDFIDGCKIKGIPTVPFLYIGPYSKQIVDTFTKGCSILDTIGTSIREGCVVKPLEEKINPYIGRLCLKSINSEYLLLKNNSEFH